VGDLSLCVHPHAVHERHVEHHGAVSRCQARDVVSAALDAKQKIVFSRKLHARDHVGDADAAHDKRRFPVDHSVPNGSGLLVAGVTRFKHRTPEAHLQTVQRVLIQVSLKTFQRFCFHGGFHFRLISEAFNCLRTLVLCCALPNLVIK
jgi:hypothetical protein